VEELSDSNNELESGPASESSTADSQKSKSTYDPQPTPDSSDKLRRRITMPSVDHVDEKVLDVQTQEYYRFGESTWDLFLFIGTGALGPLGSIQTFLLAVVSMTMQIVFTGIAWYNFLTPEVDETGLVDLCSTALTTPYYRHYASRHPHRQASNPEPQPPNPHP
ncbi:unnamed protein product, partial [Symbiodinium sp. KB8]